MFTCFDIIITGDYMKFKNVLLASDFDGTLKNDDGIITPDVIEKIKYFINEGGYFTVCTGRCRQGFHLYDPEYINAPVLLCNGAVAYDYKKRKTVFADGIGTEGLNVLNEILKIFPDLCIELYGENEVFCINTIEDSHRHITSQDIEFKNIEALEEATRPWVKVMSPAGKNSQALQKELLKHPEINFLKTSGEWVEILKKGTDKGTGILKLGEMLGCKKEDIYAAGDGYNDIEMLVSASAGFVPENGSPEALAVAKHITRSNNQGCIAHAIEILDEIYN